ncbi:TolB family protein [Cellulomonas bogoriensis]|uniref:TolB family protein n=1 Tax=Cellulomonas bogoriensis TaxID=301388 RepID=UPI0018DD45FD|nr:PD40 domain-containing protein [Cellulomonas bogoriensis]
MSDEIALGYSGGYRAPCVRSPREAVHTDLTLTPVGGMAWSPDGTELALSASGMFGTLEMGVITLADCSWRVLTDTGPQGLSWSPDGTEIAVDDKVVSANDGQVVRDFGHGGSHPSWHPDGDLIAFTAPDGIRVVAADSGAPDPGQLLIPGGHRPSWSPDGTRIAYGTGLRAAHAAADGSGEVLLPEMFSYPDQVGWSPDGQRLTFVGSVDHPEAGEILGGACVTVTLDGELDQMPLSSQCNGMALRPPHEPDPTPDMTLVYLYRKNDLAAPPSWHNSGNQTLWHVELGHAWPATPDPSLLPPEACGPGWAVQIDWTTNLARHHVPHQISRERSTNILGWGTVVQAARHHSLEYLVDVPDCP